MRFVDTELIFWDSIHGDNNYYQPILENYFHITSINCSNFRYDIDSDIVTLVCDRCPYRGQNLDYAKYLTTALYFESWRTDAWEQKAYDDHAEFAAEISDKGEVKYDDAFKQSLEDVLNAGEDEETLRKYKEAARKLLKLPTQTASAQIV